MLTSVTRWCIIITKGHSVRPAGCCKGGKMKVYVFSKALFNSNLLKQYKKEEALRKIQWCDSFTSLMDGHIAIHDSKCDYNSMAVYVTYMSVDETRIARFECSIDDCKTFEAE